MTTGNAKLDAAIFRVQALLSSCDADGVGVVVILKPLDDGSHTAATLTNLTDASVRAVLEVALRCDPRLGGAKAHA